MVDINLIGDDNTGEEERPEEFTQTANMDTEELAFEERTETFDTTKTAGFARKRNYSSLVSTLIVFSVIVLLGGAVYYFMLGGDGPEIAEGPSGSGQASSPATDDELASLEQQFASDLAGENVESSDVVEQDVTREDFLEPVEDEPVVSRPVVEAEPEPEPVRPAARPSGSSAALSRNEPPVTEQLFSRSRSGVRSVTSLMGSVPSSLSTTLISFAGERAHFEVVASSSSDARAFAKQLSSMGSFAVVSENSVASNGQSLEKVLVSGKIAPSGTSSSGENVRFYSGAEARDWIRKTAERYGLSVRELKTQAGSYAGGYQKVPLLGRIRGNQSSLISFLEEMGNEAVNLEFAKILLVSPDMVSYRDDNLILILNLFLYEQS